MRLIDADALRTDAITRSGGTEFSFDNCYPFWQFSQAIAQAPAVDAVEVVRCEKCLYRSQYSDESGHYKCGGLLTEDEEPLLMVKPDFFCAYGKRRADNAAD